MKIAIDIDGTIYDTEREMKVQAEIFDIDELNKNSLVEPKALWTDDRYNWNEEENEKFLSKLYYISQKSKLIPGAKDIIERLQKKGVETIIITARGGVYGEDNKAMVKIIKEKLKEDGLKFDGYFWKQLDKVEVCKREKVDYLIDDSPIVCKQTCEAGIKTIFLRDAGVYDIKPNEKLVEVHHWGEIYRYLIDKI